MKVNTICSLYTQTGARDFPCVRAEKMFSVVILYLGYSGGLVSNPVFHHGPHWQGSGCSCEGQSHVSNQQVSR